MAEQAPFAAALGYGLALALAYGLGHRCYKKTST